jgi:dynein assembly factor 3
MLFLALVSEHPTRLGLQEKAELFLELYGNSLIRQQTFEYLQAKCDQFIKFVTNLDYMAQKFKLLDLSQLKFKERDTLESIFKFWRNSDHTTFPVAELWEQRLRHSLKTRYDARQGVFDWDYSMKLQDKASIVYSREYKHWRETGVAFSFREGGYDIPNRTLASGLLVTRGGDKVAQRGYWGDIVNSPFLGLGIETERAELLKKVNDRHAKTSGDVAIYNVTAYIHEMLTGTQYALHNASAKETAGSKPTMMEKIDEDESKPLPSSDAKDTGSASRKETKLSAMEEMEFHSPVDVTITFLPINSAGELHKKSKYHKLFDIIYFSNSMVHSLTEGIQAAFASQAAMIIETTKFLCWSRNKKQARST